MDELRDCLVIEFTNGIKFYIGFDSSNKKQDIGEYDLCVYLGEIGIYNKLMRHLKNEKSALGSLCVTVESTGRGIIKGGERPVKNKDIVIMKREQDTKIGFGTGISFESIKYKHRRSYKITSCVVVETLDNFKSAKVYDSGGERLDILEDICVQRMLGYELMDKSMRLNKVEVSYANGVGTLSLSVKCAKENKQ